MRSHEAQYESQKQTVTNEVTFYKVFSKMVIKLNKNQFTYQDFREEFVNKYHSQFPEDGAFELQYKPKSVESIEASFVDSLEGEDSEYERAEEQKRAEDQKRAEEQKRASVQKRAEERERARVPEKSVSRSVSVSRSRSLSRSRSRHISVEVDSQEQSFDDLGLGDDFEQTKRLLEIEKENEIAEASKIKILELQIMREQETHESLEIRVNSLIQDLNMQQDEYQLLKFEKEKLEMELKTKLSENGIETNPYRSSGIGLDHFRVSSIGMDKYRASQIDDGYLPTNMDGIYNNRDNLIMDGNYPNPEDQLQNLGEIRAKRDSELIGLDRKISRLNEEAYNFELSYSQINYANNIPNDVLKTNDVLMNIGGSNLLNYDLPNYER